MLSKSNGCHPRPQSFDLTSARRDADLQVRHSIVESRAGKSLICILINVERVGRPIAAAFVRRNICLAVIPRAHARTRVDDLYHDAFAHAADIRTTITALIRDGVASSAIASWASGSLVAVVGTLALTVIVVDLGIAGSAADVGRDIACCGTVGSSLAGERPTDCVALGLVVVEGGYATPGLAGVFEPGHGC